MKGHYDSQNGGKDTQEATLSATLSTGRAAFVINFKRASPGLARRGGDAARRAMCHAARQRIGTQLALEAEAGPSPSTPLERQLAAHNETYVEQCKQIQDAADEVPGTHAGVNALVANGGKAHREKATCQTV